MQLNCHRSLSATSNLAGKMDSNSIACVQEPSFNESIKGFDGFEIVAAKNCRPRAAMAVGKDMNFWPDTRFCSRDLAAGVLYREGNNKNCLLYTSPSPRDRG